MTKCKQIFCPYRHPRPMGEFERSKHFSESGHVAYQIKGGGGVGIPWSSIPWVVFFKPVGIYVLYSNTT